MYLLTLATSQKFPRNPPTCHWHKSFKLPNFTIPKRDTLKEIFTTRCNSEKKKEATKNSFLSPKLSTDSPSELDFPGHGSSSSPSTRVFNIFPDTDNVPEGSAVISPYASSLFIPVLHPLMHALSRPLARARGPANVYTGVVSARTLRS